MSTLPQNIAPHVVILGAGYAGSLLAKALQPATKQGKIRLSIIERRDAMQ